MRLIQHFYLNVTINHYLVFVITSDVTSLRSNVDFGQKMRQKYVVSNIQEEFYVEDTRDARYTGTVKLPAFIIFQTVRYHDFVYFGISYAAVPKFTCRWQCFSNCCVSGKCDTRTSEQHDGSNRLNC